MSPVSAAHTCVAGRPCPAHPADVRAGGGLGPSSWHRKPAQAVAFLTEERSEGKIAGRPLLPQPASAHANSPSSQQSQGPGGSSQPGLLRELFPVSRHARTVQLGVKGQLSGAFTNRGESVVARPGPAREVCAVASGSHARSHCDVGSLSLLLFLTAPSSFPGKQVWGFLSRYNYLACPPHGLGASHTQQPSY